MSKRILFISHDASRTGAPILLLRFANLIKQKKNYKIDFLINVNGELTKEFRQCGKTFVLNKNSSTIKNKILNKVCNWFIKSCLVLKKKQYDIIISNTITNGDLHKILKNHNCVYTYVHELEYTTKASTTQAELKNVLDHTYKFITPNKVIDSFLERSFKIEPSKIFQIPCFIPDHLADKQEFRSCIKKFLGIEDNITVVGGVGTIDWRKGTDVFLQVAKKHSELSSLTKFIWCGGEPDTKEWLSFNIDVQKLGLQDIILLLPTTDLAYKIMAAFDIFLLTSREDPYPLVMIEAAMMKTPIVYFTKSGGAEEFVNNDCGIGVKYLNIEEMAKAIKALTQDKELYEKFSNNARKKYFMLHTEESVLKASSQIFI